MSRILSLNINKEICGEKLDIITPTLNRDEMKVRERFQFHDDRNRVREILALDGDYLLVKTLGCTEDLPFYKCHYSQLKKNETQIEELK